MTSNRSFKISFNDKAPPMFRFVNLCLLVISVGWFASCANSNFGKNVRWTDPDMKNIAKPNVVNQYAIWDFIDHSVFYPLGTLLDLEWTTLRIGGRLGLGQGKQADNLNALDEVPNSSWFENRHFHQTMTIDQLVEGPGSAQPDTSDHWTVVSGKTVGVTSGFTIVDPSGNRFVLKFDVQNWPEMSSAAEAISTRIFYAAGYSVPRNSVVFFNPSQLELSPEAILQFPDGSSRRMTQKDLNSILESTLPLPDGRLRCLASAYLIGEPLGPPGFHGRRRSDPNDRVLHEHRRELRGMRILSSWLNDTDRRTSNMLDFYVTGESGAKYVKHYVIDMGATLGSNSWNSHMPRYGNEYLWDPGNIVRSLFSLGFRTTRWDEPLPLPYRSIGYYENDTFQPGNWVPSYPNAAFLWRTDRDGYWGAKIVMSFSDEAITEIVKTGRLSNPEAEAELTRLMIERRDMIGRYWFGRVNPLDQFAVENGSLRFSDLAVIGGLEQASQSRYQVVISGTGVSPPRILDGEVTISLQSLLPGEVYRCDLRTRRQSGRPWSDRTRVTFTLDGDGNGEIVRIERED